MKYCHHVERGGIFFSSYAIALKLVTLKISELLLPTQPGGLGVDIILDPGGRLAWVFHTT